MAGREVDSFDPAKQPEREGQREGVAWDFVSLEARDKVGRAQKSTVVGGRGGRG